MGLAGLAQPEQPMSDLITLLVSALLLYWAIPESIAIAVILNLWWWDSARRDQATRHAELLRAIEHRGYGED
jgi:hypothetical protein